MRTPTFLLLSIVSLLSGCYAEHERMAGGSATAPSSDDPAYTTASTARPAPAGAGCAIGQWSPLAPAGLTDLRMPTLVAIDGGFVAGVSHATPDYDYPTALGRMRSDLTNMLDAPHDAGIVTSQGGEVSRPAMTVGGDGRIASCAVSYTTPGVEWVPGGVAFFDASGVLQHIERFDFGCADVAWVDGRWVALEIQYDDPSAPPENLVVFDASLAIAQRIPLAFRGISATFADRVIGYHGRAIVVGPTDDEALAMGAVDLDTLAIDVQPFPYVAPSNLTASQFVLVTHDALLGIAWIDAYGGVAYATFDDSLRPTREPIALGSAETLTSYIDATEIDGGIAIAWAWNGLALVMLGDDGSVTAVGGDLSVYGATGGIETLEIAAQGDVIALAIEVDDPSAARLSVGIWSSRCRMR